jgi:glycosyltransferase involved in cell wall biosynthesis
MRIVIDTHAIGSGLTGNERYIQNLAQHLLALDGKNEYYFFFSEEQARRQWESRAPNLRAGLVSRNPYRRLGFDFVVQLLRLRPQVFHYQYTGPPIQLSPEVVTIHDVSFEEHPDYFARGERLRLRLTVRRAVRSARRIITVSEFSKAEIIRLLKVPEQKIKVIYNGVGPEFRPIRGQEAIQSHLERYSIQKPYLLAVGNICRRKNQLAMVRGFARWLEREPDYPHRLVLAGKQGIGVKEVLSEVTRLGLDSSRVTLLGFVADENLPYLYAGAELLLNTSHYEGFGLPVVEAMACGLPVVLSRASCFPEIAADAARYVNPDDPDDVAAAIAEILGNSARREECVERGLARAQHFRWDVAARETLKVYTEVAGNAAVPT